MKMFGQKFSRKRHELRQRTWFYSAIQIGCGKASVRHQSFYCPAVKRRNEKRRHKS
jgi:predicted metalloprotease